MWLGSFIIACSFGIGCVLLVAQSVMDVANPYLSLATFGLPPAGMTLGAVFVGIGALLKWRRRRRSAEAKALPVLDLNSRRTLGVVFAGGIVLVLVVAVSGVGAYGTYHFTESTNFCGNVCHSVMEPEYEAHRHSSHARVACVSCHIGPGADWYVRSKLDGVRQVWSILTSSYELPIRTPLHNLRPARDTCEECHWPAKFSGSIEKVLWRFWFDKDNTSSRYHLLMKVGGVNPANGRREGIHWHIDSAETVRYWARDAARSDIPWVEVRRADGRRVVYRSAAAPPDPPAAQVRLMDCIDCHNRPAHVMLSPSELVDMALGEGALDRRVPYMKRNAVGILSTAYGSRAEAHRGIAEEVRRRFPVDAQVTAQAQGRIAATLTELHDRHDYPDQGSSWRHYPSHLGHKVSPGCFRCHDGLHKAPDGTAISRDCSICHDITYQAHGEKAYGVVAYRVGEFEHPPGEVISYKTRLCPECHDPKVSWYPANAAAARPAAARPAESGKAPAP
jgi:nitrate/TMAO reductase-like tetraheme cytochrome c subunit